MFQDLCVERHRHGKIFAMRCIDLHRSLCWITSPYISICVEMHRFTGQLCGCNLRWCKANAVTRVEKCSNFQKLALQEPRLEPGR